MPPVIDFSPSRAPSRSVLWPLLTSHDKLYAILPTRTTSVRPPRVRTHSFSSRSYSIYPNGSVQLSDFTCSVDLSVVVYLMEFLFISSRFAYGFFQPTPRGAHLAFDYEVSTDSSSRDFHPLGRAYNEHITTKPPPTKIGRGLFKCHQTLQNDFKVSKQFSTLVRKRERSEQMTYTYVKSPRILHITARRTFKLAVREGVFA